MWMPAWDVEKVNKGIAHRIEVDDLIRDSLKRNDIKELYELFIATANNYNCLVLTWFLLENGINPFKYIPVKDKEQIYSVSIFHSMQFIYDYIGYFNLMDGLEDSYKKHINLLTDTMSTHEFCITYELHRPEKDEMKL